MKTTIGFCFALSVTSTTKKQVGCKGINYFFRCHIMLSCTIYRIFVNEDKATQCFDNKIYNIACLCSFTRFAYVYRVTRSPDLNNMRSQNIISNSLPFVHVGNKYTVTVICILLLGKAIMLLIKPLKSRNILLKCLIILFAVYLQSYPSEYTIIVIVGIHFLHTSCL